MSLLKNIGWTNFKSPFTGRSPINDRLDNSSVRKNVDEEYRQAFRTKSYNDLLSKVQGQLRTPSTGKLLLASSSVPHLTNKDLPESVFKPPQENLMKRTLSLNLYAPLDMHGSEESLLEPPQETLMDMAETLDLHHLLVDYFKASSQACDSCELILQGVGQTRKSYQNVKNIVQLTTKMHEETSNDEYYQAVIKELSAIAMLNNPMLVVSPVEFLHTHESNKALFGMLTEESKRLKSKGKMIKYLKNAGGCVLVTSHSALITSLLIAVVHSIVGIVIAPGLMACSYGLLKDTKMFEMANKSMLERIGAQLDIAAKGVYIMINDFDTMSILVKNLQAELEHWRSVAEICGKNRRHDVLHEAVKELFTDEIRFLKNLKELEQQICLCVLNINRSRRLVAQEIENEKANQP